MIFQTLHIVDQRSSLKYSLAICLFQPFFSCPFSKRFSHNTVFHFDSEPALLRGTLSDEANIWSDRPYWKIICKFTDVLIHKGMSNEENNTEVENEAQDMHYAQIQLKDCIHLKGIRDIFLHTILEVKCQLPITASTVIYLPFLLGLKAGCEMHFRALSGHKPQSGSQLPTQSFLGKL